MTDYIGLIEGRLATTDARLGQVLSWLRDVRPGTPNLDGHGNYVDAWRHGGTAALLAYHHGYDNVERWGDALEDYQPDNEWEFRQDVWNNEVGAKIGALARITGMTIPELGDAVKAAFRAGAFQTDAYAPFSGGPTFKVGNMTLSVGSGIVTLPDGSRFDLTKSKTISDGDHEYPLLHVIRKDGSVDNWANKEDGRTLFQDGIGKWEPPQGGDAPAVGSLQNGWLSSTLPESLSAPSLTSSMFSSTPIAKSSPTFGGAIGIGNTVAPDRTASAPWYSSPAVTGNYTPTENFNWNNVPTGSPGSRGPLPPGGSGNAPAPALRVPQQDRRSAAPDDPAWGLAQGAMPAVPTSPQNAAYSPAGNVARNFARTPVVAAPPPSASSNVLGLNPALWMASDPAAVAQGMRNLAGGAGRFAGSGLPSSAQAALPSNPLWPSTTTALDRSGNPGFSGGLPGRLAAVLAGVDPTIQPQPAASQSDDGTQGPDETPVRRLSRSNNNSPDLVADASAPAPRFVLPGDLTLNGDLADWLANLGSFSLQNRA